MMDLNSFPQWACSEDRPYPGQDVEDCSGLRCVRFAIVMGVLAAVLLLSIAVREVEANGAPVDIFLDFIPGMSTWGPAPATGHAVVSVGEGEVRLEIQGLPRLKGEIYQAWLQRADTGEMIPVGTFNSDEQGNGRLHVLLDDLPYTTYRMMLISVEPGPGPSEKPSDRWALVGRFPNTAVVPEALLKQEKPAEGSSDIPRPEFLPVTGGERGERSILRDAIVGAAVVFGILIFVLWGGRQEETR